MCEDFNGGSIGRLRPYVTYEGIPCLTCGGVALYRINGKRYCKRCLPKKLPVRRDATLEAHGR
jgi:hypothetical protein